MVEAADGVAIAVESAAKALAGVVGNRSPRVGVFNVSAPDVRETDVLSNGLSSSGISADIIQLYSCKDDDGKTRAFALLSTDTNVTLKSLDTGNTITSIATASYHGIMQQGKQMAIASKDVLQVYNDIT